MKTIMILVLLLIFNSVFSTEPLLNYKNANIIQHLPLYSALQYFSNKLTKTEKLAKLGFAPAQYYLAQQYTDGRYPLPLDMHKAFYWYHAAAIQGDPRAQYEVGKRYWQGVGVDKDFDNAKHWLYLSAMQGNVQGQKAWVKFVIILSKQWNQQRPQCHSLNLYNLTMMQARDGDPIKMFQSGLLAQYTGHIKKALYWYHKSAADQYWPAVLKLGMLYYAGTDRLQENVWRSQKYFLQAHQLGSELAFNMLAILANQGVYSGHLDRHELRLCVFYGMVGCWQLWEKRHDL